MDYQLYELYGLDKLNDQEAKEAEAAFDKLVAESGDPNESPYIRMFLARCGVQYLNESDQKNIIEKTCFIVRRLRAGGSKMRKQYFKWDTLSESLKQMNRKPKASDYRWHTNRTVPLETDTKKVKKSDYRWSTDGYGSQTGV